MGGVFFSLSFSRAPPTATRDYRQQRESVRREARYCEYRSQKTFPSSISTLAIETYSRSEHSRAQASHCLFLPKSRAHASAPAHTILPFRVLTPSLIRSASLLPGSQVRGRQSSMCLHSCP